MLWNKLLARLVSDGLVHHSDRGVQYLSIRYTECLAEAGIEPSVGSAGDSYDNATAETIIAMFKTEGIHLRVPAGAWTMWSTISYLGGLVQ